MRDLSIIGFNSGSLTAQKIFINNIKDVINRRVDIQEDIERFQNVLNYASSKVDYNVGYGIYMLPSNMNLNIGAHISGYNNEILISKSNFSLGVNSVVNAKLSGAKTKLSEQKKELILKNLELN